MTDANLLANCGCGYKTRSLEEAVKHSETYNHRMTISGTITPTKKPVMANMATAAGVSVPTDVSQIDALRRKIGNGK